MISIASSIRPWAAPGRDVTELPEVMGEYSWITGRVTFGKCFFTWSLETQWRNLEIEESLFPKAERDCKQQRLQARMGKQKTEQQPSTEILPKNKVQNTRLRLVIQGVRVQMRRRGGSLWSLWLQLLVLWSSEFRTFVGQISIALLDDIFFSVPKLVLCHGTNGFTIISGLGRKWFK